MFWKMKMNGQKVIKGSATIKDTSNKNNVQHYLIHQVL